MASKATSAKLLKLLFNLCFGVLFFDSLAVAEWIIALGLMPKSPLARLAPVIATLLGIQIISLVFYFWKPWITVVIAWVGVFLIAARAIPWGSPSWFSVVRQFQFQLVFLVAAHVGLGLYVLVKRAEAGMVSEMVSGAVSPPVAEKETAGPADRPTDRAADQSVDPQTPSV